MENRSLSELPESVLLRILCFLSQKKAVQTSVLSKSWRHLGPTRPVIDLHEITIDHVCETCFRGNKETTFVSLLDSTFQRYHDHNIFPQELRLQLADSQSIWVLEKWIPIIFDKPNACSTAAFRISFGSWPCFDLPSVVFRVESLRELHMEICRVNDINLVVVLKNLQSLSLYRVVVSDKALEKIISGCPLVKRLVLDSCEGFKTVDINGSKNRCLDYFHISSYNKAISIAINAPALENICMEGYLDWYPNNNNNNNCFLHLKSLFLSHVTLSSRSFHYFSSNFPCLEELSVLDCFDCEEINLSSRSIERLIIRGARKVDIEVPNILYFELSNSFLPTTLSLATTSSREWKSHLNLSQCLDGYGDNDGVLPTILDLFGLVNELSQSQISLTLVETFNFKMNQIECDFNDRPVVVQHLGLTMFSFCPDFLARYLNALFRIFRPRYTNAVRVYGKNDEKVTKFLWKTLVHEREKIEYGWEQHLEEVSIEASDENGKVWHHVEWTCLLEWSANQKIRFRLKWSD